MARRSKITRERAALLGLKGKHRTLRNVRTGVCRVLDIPKTWLPEGWQGDRLIERAMAEIVYWQEQDRKRTEAIRSPRFGSVLKLKRS